MGVQILVRFNSSDATTCLDACWLPLVTLFAGKTSSNTGRSEGVEAKRSFGVCTLLHGYVPLCESREQHLGQGTHYSHSVKIGSTALPQQGPVQVQAVRCTMSTATSAGGRLLGSSGSRTKPKKRKRKKSFRRS